MFLFLFLSCKNLPGSGDGLTPPPPALRVGSRRVPEPHGPQHLGVPVPPRHGAPGRTCVSALGCSLGPRRRPPAARLPLSLPRRPTRRLLCRFTGGLPGGWSLGVRPEGSAASAARAAPGTWASPSGRSVVPERPGEGEGGGDGGGDPAVPFLQILSPPRQTGCGGPSDAGCGISCPLGKAGADAGPAARAPGPVLLRLSLAGRPPLHSGRRLGTNTTPPSRDPKEQP